MNILPNEFRDALINAGTEFYIGPEGVLIEFGETTTDVYLVVSGRLRVSLLSRRGREPHFADLEAGSLFGELAAIDNQPRSARVSAITRAVIVKISASTFRTTLFQNEEWVWWLLRVLSARSRELTERTFEFATLSVHGRVLSEIIRFAKLGQYNNDDNIIVKEFPTHEELASRIGTQREAVTRSLRNLTKANVIQQNGRRLEIISVNQLRAHFLAEGGEWYYE